MTEEKRDSTGYVIPNKRIQVRSDPRDDDKGWIVEIWNRAEESGEIIDIHWKFTNAIREAERARERFDLPISVILTTEELRTVVKDTVADLTDGALYKKL